MKTAVNTKDISTVILQSSVVAVPKCHLERSETLWKGVPQRVKVMNLSFPHSPPLNGVVKTRWRIGNQKKHPSLKDYYSHLHKLRDAVNCFLLCLFSLLLLSGCAREEATVKYSLKKAPEKSVRAPRLLPKQYWEGKLPSGSFINNTPNFVTIMDLKEELTEPEEILTYLREQQLTAIDNNWGDIPFHFYIDRYGNIFQGRLIESTAPVMEDFIDPEGHIFIMMMNDFKDTPLGEGEKNSLVHLILWLRSKYKISAEGVDSIKKYDQSLAPGRLLQVYFDQNILLDEEDQK